MCASYNRLQFQWWLQMLQALKKYQTSRNIHKHLMCRLGWHHRVRVLFLLLLLSCRLFRVFRHRTLFRQWNLLCRQGCRTGGSSEKHERIILSSAREKSKKEMPKTYRNPKLVWVLPDQPFLKATFYHVAMVVGSISLVCFVTSGKFLGLAWSSLGLLHHCSIGFHNSPRWEPM